jgi:TorA maturation chaperone TorD
MTDALTDFCSGVALDLLILAQLHDRELTDTDVKRLQQDRFPETLAFRLQSDKAREAMTILAHVVADLTMDERQHDDLAADFAAIYLTHGLGASPYESVWLDDDGLAMQQPMFDIRARYAQYGLEVPDWRKRSDDHLVFQLQFIATLLEDAQPSALTDAATFLDAHTLRWLPDFAGRVATRANTPFYASLAVLTACHLDELRDVLAEILDEPRPNLEELAQAEAPTVDEEPLPMPGRYVPGSAPSW